MLFTYRDLVDADLDAGFLFNSLSNLEKAVQEWEQLHPGEELRIRFERIKTIGSEGDNR